MTIGFTRRSAQDFFTTLEMAGAQRVVDVRLRNTSQLAGFAKRDDLAFLLHSVLVGADYEHRVEAAPTPELLDAYRGGELEWDDYAAAFGDLLTERAIEEEWDPADFERPTVLLCSEPPADQCHRRLIVEHLADHWDDVTARHL